MRRTSSGGSGQHQRISLGLGGGRGRRHPGRQPEHRYPSTCGGGYLYCYPSLWSTWTAFFPRSTPGCWPRTIWGSRVRGIGGPSGHLLRDMVHYRVRTGILEREDGRHGWAECVLQSDVRDVLQWAYDNHGHYKMPTTMRNLSGRYWWPTRYDDVTRWLRTCHICESFAPALPKKVDPLPAINILWIQIVVIDMAIQYSSSDRCNFEPMVEVDPAESQDMF